MRKEGVMGRASLVLVCVAAAACLSGCFNVDSAGPTCGPVVYEESFDGAGSGWPESADPASQTSILDGRYRVEVAAADSYVYVQNDGAGPYADFCFSATVWDRSDGAAQAAGLVFRWTDDGRFYVFSISPESATAIFAVFFGGRARPIHAAHSEAIRGVGEENRLHLIANGSHFLFYVNDELVLDEVDEQLASGGIGVHGASWETIPSVLEFDDLVIRRFE
jgi:hypothetical protein